MPSNVMDSELYRGIFISERMRSVFSDDSLTQKWLDTWAALAKAEAEVGLIPEEAALKIAEKADYRLFDKTLIREGIVDTTHPLIVQIRQFTDAVGGREGGYIHWGATTRDIMDTAVVLQIKEAHELLIDQLNEFLTTLLNLADKYKNTIMAGRTHGQHALPITLGYKIAIWADEIGKHIERLETGSNRYLVSSFSGAAGTLASLREKGLDIQEKFSKNLDLKQPIITWHVQRDGFAEFSSYVAMIAGTVGKIANEIINLQKTEIGEIEEGFKDGQIGSSTMPHKRNPMICEYVVGLTRVIQRNASLSFDAMIQEHERDMTFWMMEWSYIPQISMMASGAIEQMQGVMERFIVHEDKMKSNLEQLKGLIVSENLMMKLGEHVGRQIAHDMVYKVSMKAFEKDRHLLEVTLEDEEIMNHLSEQDVKDHLDPSSYVGLCAKFVDRVKDEWKNNLTDKGG